MSVMPSISTELLPELEEMWREYHSTRSIEQLDLLTVAYLPHVRKMADRIAKKLPRSVEAEDLVQEGVLGLRRAIQAFDPHRGVLFTTFVAFPIRGAILDSLRNADWTPRLVQTRSRAVGEATRRFEMAAGRKPSEMELTEALRMSEKDAQATLRDGRRAKQFSLPIARNHNGTKAFSPEDMLPASNAPNPVALAEGRELRELITHGLTRAERLILMLYYYENMTMKEIGLTLDLSESRVSQMHSSVVERLRATMTGKQYLFRDGIDGC